MKKVMMMLAIFATLLAAGSCTKPNNNDPKDPNKEEPNNDDPNKEDPNKDDPKVEVVTITIDGNFDDWADVDASKGAAIAKTNPNAPWDGVKEIRCFSNADFVYYYIRYDKDTVEEQLTNKDALNIRLCLNTDGEFTSGYQKYFLDYYDFIIEGPLGDGEGHFGTYDGTLHQHSGGTSSSDFQEILKPGNNLVTGKGSGNEYEIMLARELFNNAVPAGQKIGDVFHTGIRFYCDGWNEMSNMPNASADEGEGNGWAHLMEVTTVK